MNFEEAYEIYELYLDKDIYCNNDEYFLFTEAAKFLYDRTGECEFITNLGAVYYERKEFDLARKYYEIAAEKNDRRACIGLGAIWYYGRTGEKDYKKAYEYFSRCKGDIKAEYMLADMYRTGRYVEKDEKKYESIIEKLYELLQYGHYKYYFPEIYSSLARIRMTQGRDDETYILLCEARKVLEYRIDNEDFFGDYTLMKGIIEDLHKNKLYPVKHPYYDVFDLYVLFTKPCKAEIVYYDVDFDTGLIKEDYTEPITAVEEDGAIVIDHNGKWYRSVDDFLRKNYYMCVGIEEVPGIRILE